jgi:lysophospholipase L1-like esterase
MLALGACASREPPSSAGPPPTTLVTRAPAPAASSGAGAAGASDAPSAAPELRYLALGDSFTAGTGSRPVDAFPVRLADRLRARGVAVTIENLGVNGYTTDDLIADELPRLASFAPTCVTLAIGANDLVHGSSVERYRGQVRAILGAIVAARVPPPRVFVLPQPDWSGSPVAASFGAPKALRARIDAFNDTLRAEAEAAGARWVDLGPTMRRQAAAGMVASDGLHPAARAYDEWAEALLPIVTPVARVTKARSQGSSP